MLLVSDDKVSSLEVCIYRYSDLAECIHMYQTRTLSTSSVSTCMSFPHPSSPALLRDADNVAYTWSPIFFPKATRWSISTIEPGIYHNKSGQRTRTTKDNMYRGLTVSRPRRRCKTTVTGLLESLTSSSLRPSGLSRVITSYSAPSQRRDGAWT